MPLLLILLLCLELGSRKRLESKNQSNTLFPHLHASFLRSLVTLDHRGLTIKNYVTFYSSSLILLLLLLLLPEAASASFRLSTRIVNCISRSCLARLGVVCSVTQPTTAPSATSGVYLARSSRASSNRFVLLANFYEKELILICEGEEAHTLAVTALGHPQRQRLVDGAGSEDDDLVVLGRARLAIDGEEALAREVLLLLLVALPLFLLFGLLVDPGAHGLGHVIPLHQHDVAIVAVGVQPVPAAGVLAPLEEGLEAVGVGAQAQRRRLLEVVEEVLVRLEGAGGAA